MAKRRIASALLTLGALTATAALSITPAQASVALTTMVLSSGDGLSAAQAAAMRPVAETTELQQLDDVPGVLQEMVVEGSKGDQLIMIVAYVKPYATIMRAVTAVEDSTRAATDIHLVGDVFARTSVDAAGELLDRLSGTRTSVAAADGGLCPYSDAVAVAAGALAGAACTFTWGLGCAAGIGAGVTLVAAVNAACTRPVCMISSYALNSTQDLRFLLNVSCDKPVDSLEPGVVVDGLTTGAQDRTVVFPVCYSTKTCNNDYLVFDYPTGNAPEEHCYSFDGAATIRWSGRVIYERLHAAVTAACHTETPNGI